MDRAMRKTRSHLTAMGLPDRDLGELRASAKRFADGTQYPPGDPLHRGPAGVSPTQTYQTTTVDQFGDQK